MAADAPASRLADVGAALLVGGASSRMGRDKAGLTLGGSALATRLSALLARHFQEVLLVGGDPPAEAGGRRVPDRDEDGPRSALRGVRSALAASGCERVLLLATDLPFVPAELLLALVAWPEADAVLARDARGPQPLCGVYRREPALAAAERCWSEGRLALAAWLDPLEVAALPPDVQARLDPPGRALANLNTPEELREAERWLRAGDRG